MLLNIIYKIGAIIPRPVKTVILFVNNVFIIWLFLQALINPEIHADWIYSSAIMIFILEFLSIHSSGMSVGLATENKKSNQKIFLMFFYLFFVIVVSFFFHNWFLLLYFIISTYIKIYEIAQFPPQKIVIPFVALGIFMTTTVLVIHISPLIKTLFPFPATVLQSKPAGASGLFVETPQVTMVWGIVYFSIHFIINVVFFIKAKIKKV